MEKISPASFAAASLLVTGVLVTVSAAIESTLDLSALVYSLAVLEEAAVEEGRKLTGLLPPNYLHKLQQTV